MKSIAKLFILSVISIFTLISCSSDEEQASQQLEKYQEGKHYSVLKDPIEYDLEKGKNGVIWEVFSYGCAHCNSYEPIIQKWLKSAPKTTQFEHVPVYWNSQYAMQAKAYYTAKLLGVADKGHQKLFDAIHIQKARIGSIDDYATFYSQFGISKEQFKSTSESFAVKAKVEKTRDISKQGEVEGTPSLIVNGKYLIKSRKDLHRNEWLEIAQFLVERDAKNP